MGGERKRVRGLCLFSGGLDSQLAVCLLREQGIEMHAVTFESPLMDPEPGRRHARRLGIPVQTLDLTRDVVDLFRAVWGQASGAEALCPQIYACMLRRCRERMDEEGFAFVATGDVLGQHPVTQSLEAFAIADAAAGLTGRVVRPLTAGLLPVTPVETGGAVDRTRLLDLQGRSRSAQLQWAARLGIGAYVPPTATCRLQDPCFRSRLADLMQHGPLEGARALALLRYGRHFRLTPSIKLIVGRNEHDNLYLEGSAELYDLVLRLDDGPGPTAVMSFIADEDTLRLGAAICARYSDADKGKPVRVRVRSPRGMRRIDVQPFTPEWADGYRIA